MKEKRRKLNKTFFFERFLTSCLVDNHQTIQEHFDKSHLNHWKILEMTWGALMMITLYALAEQKFSALCDWFLVLNRHTTSFIKSKKDLLSMVQKLLLEGSKMVKISFFFFFTKNNNK